LAGTARYDHRDAKTRQRHIPNNHRGGALLTRLGFEPEGYSNEYLLIDGQWQDHILTVLTHKEWLPPR